MRECKIGVGGCGGHLYKTFLESANELFGPVLGLKSPLGCEKGLVTRRKMEWKSLFEGLWLDLDLDDVKRFNVKPVEERVENEDYYDGYYYIYGNKGRDKLPPELEEKMIRAIGYTMEDPGFIHRPELQMIAFAVLEIRKYICKMMYKKIEDVEFDSLFFFVGLGGGTGTGVISNITDYIRNESKKTYPSFVLAALTGKNDGRILTQATFYRRSFNALWALSDLLAGKKVDCVILMDNDKISEREEVKKEIDKLEYEERKGDLLNEYIIRSIFPLLGGYEIEEIDEADWQRKMALSDFKPILIPCYWHGKMNLKDLIKNAITKGKLAGCDHKTADAAYVITKGFMGDKKKIEGIVKEGLETADVTVEGLKVWRTGKTGGDRMDKEILILLSNPGIKELLPERIEAAITFIRLIQNNSDDGAIKKVSEAASVFLHLKGQILEDYVQRVRDEAWEFLHLKEPYKFTEDAIEGKRRFIDDFKEELEHVKDRIGNGEREIFKENAKIKLGYLFSMAAQLEDDLNKGNISEKLKDVFETYGFPLLENATITNSDDGWEITDEEKKFIVWKEEGKLSVYSSLETEQEREIRKRVEQMEEKIRLLERKPTLSKGFDLMLKDREELKRKIESLEKTIPSEDFVSILNDIEELKKLKDKVESLGKPIPSEGVELMPKDVEELKELRDKVESLSSRSETLEAGEKLSTLYWLKQMTEINSISKDMKELKKLKEKVKPLGKPIPSKDFKELKEKVESLSRSETLEAGEKLGILNRLKQVVKIKPKEVSKPSLPEEKINSISKGIEALKKKEEKKEIGGRIIEEEII
jgi:cell division GTPase FtsZ